MARNTIVGYGYDWRMWCAWCEEANRTALPATAETVSLYLTDLLEAGKKISTARRRKCAIAHHHREAGHASPINQDVLDLLRGAQRIRAEKPRQMAPLFVRQLRAISAKLQAIDTDAAIRNRALLVIGFASALRRSNLAQLTTADVEFCRQGLILAINREKTDQEGKGRLIGIPRGRNRHTDPVRVLRAWLRRRGSEPGPLFPRLDRRHEGQPLDGECVCRIVKAAVARVGLDPAKYGAHSLRIGFVSECGLRGVAPWLIAAQTGHRSMATLRRYFRRTELFRSNAASQVGL